MDFHVYFIHLLSFGYVLEWTKDDCSYLFNAHRFLSASYRKNTDRSDDFWFLICVFLRLRVLSFILIIPNFCTESFVCSGYEIDTRFCRQLRFVEKIVNWSTNSTPKKMNVAIPNVIYDINTGDEAVAWRPPTELLQFELRKIKEKTLRCFFLDASLHCTTLYFFARHQATIRYHFTDVDVLSRYEDGG